MRECSIIENIWIKNKLQGISPILNSLTVLKHQNKLIISVGGVVVGSRDIM